MGNKISKRSADSLSSPIHSSKTNKLQPSQPTVMPTRVMNEMNPDHLKNPSLQKALDSIHIQKLVVPKVVSDPSLHRSACSAQRPTYSTQYIKNFLRDSRSGLGNPPPIIDEHHRLLLNYYHVPEIQSNSSLGESNESEEFVGIWIENMAEYRKNEFMKK